MADPYNVSALASTSDGLSVTLPTLTPLSLKPTADGTFSQQDIAVTISASDYINTYSLDMYTYDPSTTKSTTSLVGSGTNIPTIQSSSTGSFNTNGWAYSIDSGSNYQPITTTNMPITSNKPANATNTSKVTFGVRVDNTIPNGLYSATLNFVATATVKSYDIIYGTTTGISSVTLDGQACTTAISAGGCKKTLPYGETYTLTATAATGYTFSTWSKGSNDPGTFSNPTSTTATTFTVGAGAATLTPSATINQYTCTKQYRLQNADGNYPTSYTSAGTEQVDYNATCSYSQSYTDYQTQSTSGTMTTNGLTLSLDLPRNTYTLTMAKDTNISSTTPATGTSTRRWGEVINISATAASGKKFKNWTASAGTLANANNASTTFTMPVGNATVTATGEILYACPNNATSLTDSRDGQTYAIGELADGKCWMLQNLRLSGSRTLTPSDSNVKSNRSWSPNNGVTADNTRLYIYQPTGTAKIYSNGAWSNTTSTTDMGMLYNYAAVTAGTVTGSSNSIEAGEDICPAGWHLPTQAEYSSLNTAYSNNYTNFNNAFRTMLSGYFTGSSRYVGSLGGFWSSTPEPSYAAYRYNLLVNTSSVSPADSSSRDYGYSVRCMYGG